MYDLRLFIPAPDVVKLAAGKRKCNVPAAVLQFDMNPAREGLEIDVGWPGPGPLDVGIGLASVEAGTEVTVSYRTSQSTERETGLVLVLWGVKPNQLGAENIFVRTTAQEPVAVRILTRK
jgi:hypothetical protein